MTDPQDKPLLPSVIDRLTGQVQSQSTMSSQTGQSLSQMKQSVRRDLENLLNTRWRCTSWPDAMSQLNRSLVNYGIPDFSGLQMSSDIDREEFRRVVENAIRTFEPRFVSVRITMLDPNEFDDRILRFRIEADLRAVPSPIPVVFDSAVDPSSCHINIRRSES